MQEAWARELADDAELATVELELAPTARPATGSRPQVVLVDARGRVYLFKVAPLGEIAAELFAARLRRHAHELHIPAAARRLGLPDVPRELGLLQPRVEVVGELPRHPGSWTRLQCEAILRDHPWEWLLANLDSHADQYVLVGDEGLPLNVDWDHSLLDLATTEVTRFNHRSLAVVPVRNLLYAEYVAGRIALDFYGMQRQAHRIARIPFDHIEAELLRWAELTGASDRQRAGVVEAMRLRHARLADGFDAFVASLRSERRARMHEPFGPSRAVALAKESWQRFVLLVLHDRVVRPVLHVRHRLALRLVRRMR